MENLSAPRVLQVYLGDGLYGEFDGYTVKLKAPRPDGEHWVGLEPEVMESFLTWIRALALTYPALIDWWKMASHVAPLDLSKAEHDGT